MKSNCSSQMAFLKNTKCLWFNILSLVLKVKDTYINYFGNFKGLITVKTLYSSPFDGVRMYDIMYDYDMDTVVLL